MPAYSQKFKERMIDRMRGSGAVTATDLAEETGISQSTLSAWLREAGTLPPGAPLPETTPTASSTAPPVATTTPPAPKGNRERSPYDKIRLLVLAHPLTGEELGAMLRREGVHAAELDAWRDTAFEALLGRSSGTTAATGSADRKRIQTLERELERKEKALAEAAALLLLQKKLRVYLEGEGEPTDGRNGR